MTPNKKGHPVKSGPKVLTTGAVGAHAGLARTNGVSLSTPSQEYNRTNSVLIHFPGHRPQGGLAVAVIRAHPGQNCIPSDPLDAGVSQNRSSGHEGEGPPARKAKGYGQRRWVGQLRSSRIGVPKASNDGVLV